MHQLKFHTGCYSLRVSRPATPNPLTNSLQPPTLPQLCRTASGHLIISNVGGAYYVIQNIPLGSLYLKY